MRIDPRVLPPSLIAAKSPPPARKRRKGVHERLADALLELAQSKGRIAAHTEKNWASITFAGARHRVQLVFEGDDAVEAGECFIAFLPEHEFDIIGQLVADAAVVEVDHTLAPPRLGVTCELLLLEEG